MFGAFFHSFVLAQVLGLYLVITAIILLSRVKFHRELVRKLKADNMAMVVGASFGLMLGLFLVDIHNIWVMEPRLLITVLCWFILLKSILWLAFPEKMVAMGKKIYGGSGYYVVVLILAAAGVFLLARGFYFHA